MASILTGNHFNPDNDIPDLSGRVFLVTGGSAGIGRGITSHILQHKPKKLLFLSSNAEHAEEAKQFFEKFGDTSVVEWVQCDLNNLKQVQEVANGLKQSQPEIDVLVLNAGVGVGKYNETQDGYDSHFQTNVLSQFLLVNTLLPNVKAAAARTKDARIVFQSSALHKYAVDKVEFASIEEINQDIGPTHLYDRTKLALAALTIKLAQDLRAQGEKHIFVNSTHPGFVATGQQSQMYEPYGVAAKALDTVMRPFAKDPIDEGCRPALFAATSPEIVENGVNGKYIEPDKNITDPSDKAQDPALQSRLWDLNQSMLQKSLGVTV